MDRLVDGEWLESHLHAPDLRLLDCSVAMRSAEGASPTYTSARERWERAQVPGSQHADLLTISDQTAPFPMTMPGPEQFARSMGDLGVGEGTRVVLYDSLMNAFAARLWWMLRSVGFDDAAVLDGGWRSWVAEERPVTSRPPRRRRWAPSSFGDPPSPSSRRTRSARACTIPRCAWSMRSPAPSTPGRSRPTDDAATYLAPATPHTSNWSIPRRIDTSTRTGCAMCWENRPWTPGRSVIAYCGHGIAASSAAFALGLLGHDNVRIYDGSLAEWSADDSLPMVADLEQ